ncbi:MAG: hypothetical protein ACUVT2_00985 [Thiobacillaceae bacterium]
MTNTCTARASSKRTSGAWGAAPLLALLLAGCVNDTASYLVDGSKEHTIMLHRVQQWLWQDMVALTIAASRMPECRGGIDVKDVPIHARIELYQAPPEYAEPIYILKIDDRHYAISTQSCRVQAFEQAPANLGTRLGEFAEKDGKFAFIATQ